MLRVEEFEVAIGGGIWVAIRAMMASDRSRGVLSALGLHANEFGFLLGTSFTLQLFVLPALRDRTAKFLAIVCLGFVSLALLLTFSRGGYVIAMIGILAFTVVHQRKRYLIWGLVIVAVALSLAPSAIWDRVTTGMGESQAVGSSSDALTAGRVWIWQQVTPELWKNPMFGSGVGSTAWSSAVRQGLFNYNHPHNLFLRALLDVGIVGFLLFAVFVRFLLVNLSRVANSIETPPIFSALTQGARYALIGVLVAGWSNGNYIAESELSILWMAFGITLPFMRRAGITSFSPSSGKFARVS